MGNEKPDLFTVIATGERLPPRETLAEIYRDFHKIPFDEAAQMARHSWGFIAENIPEQQASEIAEKCKAAGIETALTPAGDTAAAEPFKLIIKTACDKENFSFTPEHAAQIAVPWENVLIAAAAPVKEEIVMRQTVKEGPSIAQRAVGMMLTGLPIALGKTKKIEKESKQTETAFYMDIVLKPPHGRLRMRSDNFDYSYLGSRKTYSSQTNFRIFATDIAFLSENALKNTGLLAIMERKQLAPLGYDSLNDFDKEIRRLCAVLHLRN